MIRFGLIGYGKIGERHVHHILAHPDAALAGVYDIKADRLNYFRNQYKDHKTYDALQSILQDDAIDIISICTPNYTHADIAIAAMTAGRHVLVEKPMAIRKKDCEGMIHIALKTGKSLFVVKQNRFNPPVQAVKKLIDENRLGKIYSVAV
ncbi:MAG TPA: Gfo/Idh/MocA family oxidoreductase, partial [Saprospiraceae bacterium]|nr:Gfo/Idh/MocA family oxidoreductase [Saprospiraceae bacterium]